MVKLAKTYNCQLPKPDSQGRYRPVVGKTPDGKAVKFTVGNKRTVTTAEAQRRLDYIRMLYQKQCEAHGIDRWMYCYLTWAKKFQAGPVKASGSELTARDSERAAAELAMIHQLMEWGLPITIINHDLQANGQAFISERIETEVNRAVAEAIHKLGMRWGDDFIDSVRAEVIPENIMQAETTGFHAALDAFGEHIKTTGTQVPKRLDRLKYLKQAHEDFPLWKFDLPKIEQLYAYWRNRPTTKKGSRCSKAHSTNIIKEVSRFLNWLDTSPSYKWEMPKSVDKIPRNPISLPQDNGKGFQSLTKKTFTVEQLKILAENTDQFGKALIAICVNCAWGQGEVGQWHIGDFTFFSKHPHAKELGIKTTDEDSWITGIRVKNGVYGEFYIWDKVAKAVASFFDGRPVLPITNTGKPWYRPYSTNPQSSFTNWWKYLLDRIQKKRKDFPRLPFGSLRDVLPNLLRQKYGNEVADMCLCHGDPKEHPQLKFYANRPFGNLFIAQKEMEAHFKPFLDVL